MPRQRKTPVRIRSTLRALAELPKQTREAKKLDNEQKRAERLTLKAENDAKAKAAKAEEYARMLTKDRERAERHTPKPVRPPSLTITAAAPPDILTTSRVDSTTGRIITTPVLGRDGEPLKAQPPAPTVPETNLPSHMLPVWTREGRRPNRAELAALHEAQRYGGHVTYRDGTESRPEQTSYIGPWPDPDDGNGVDLSAGPNGTRIARYDDSRDAWRNGGGNWTKKL